MKALVLGTAAGVFEDAAKALSLFKPDIVIAVNDIGVDYPDHVDHWASCHIDLFPKWISERQSKGFGPVGQIWINESKLRNLSAEQKALGYRGAPYGETSSGGLGVSVAQVLGATHIVLAGMPLTNGPHYSGDSDFTYEAHYQAQWLAMKDSLSNVRSLSGWTQELLGKPTKKWLGASVEADANDSPA